MNDPKMKIADVFPSDYISIYLTEYYAAYKGPPRLGMGEVDLTEVYEVYVDNIEKHNNFLHKQGNTMLFKFMVDYYVILWTHLNLLAYLDGTYNQYGYNIEDIQLDHLDQFVTSYSIPFGYPGLSSRETWEQLSINGNIDNVLKALRKAFQDAGISWDANMMYKTGVGNGIFYLPVRWSMLKMDPASFRSMDMKEYRRTFKYGTSLTIYMGGVPVDDMVAIGPASLEYAITYSLDPAMSSDLEFGGPDE